MDEGVSGRFGRSGFGACIVKEAGVTCGGHGIAWQAKISGPVCVAHYEPGDLKPTVDPKGANDGIGS